ncbi:MAG: lactate utilization protein [Treponemataceae bacterium]|nr:lactate utilization protein [Spirochaetales bacterium]MDY6030589.1 lactate utilization protein [Treponemataceae bacterium]
MTVYEALETQKEITAQSIIKNLKKRNMQGFYCKTKEDALKKVLELIPEQSSIGYGGSVTLEQTGILNALKNGNYNVIERENYNTPELQRELSGKIAMSDFFLMSTNAMSMDGELVNIDGRGNRVCYLIYGPQNVIVVAGWNKIETDLEGAIKRARNVAAPPNCIRLNKNTPCIKNGHCNDCFSPDCICSQFVVTRRSSVPDRIKVILVGENLGY